MKSDSLQLMKAQWIYLVNASTSLCVEQVRYNLRTILRVRYQGHYVWAVIAVVAIAFERFNKYSSHTSAFRASERE
jgi:hypothetical protein